MESHPQMLQTMDLRVQQHAVPVAIPPAQYCQSLQNIRRAAEINRPPVPVEMPRPHSPAQQHCQQPRPPPQPHHFNPYPYGLNMVKEDGVLKRIPRPRNAFMIFASEHRRRFHQIHPDVPNGEISVKLGDAWHHLPTDIKKHYFDHAKDEEKEHRRKYPFYQYRPGASSKKRRHPSYAQYAQAQAQAAATRGTATPPQTYLHVPRPVSVNNNSPSQGIAQPMSQTVQMAALSEAQHSHIQRSQPSQQAQYPGPSRRPSPRARSWREHRGKHRELSDNLSSVPDMLRISNSVVANPKIDPDADAGEVAWLKSPGFGDTAMGAKPQLPIMVQPTAGTGDGLETDMKIYRNSAERALLQPDGFTSTKYPATTSDHSFPVKFTDLPPARALVSRPASSHMEPPAMCTTKAIYQNGRVVMVEVPVQYQQPPALANLLEPAQHGTMPQSLPNCQKTPLSPNQVPLSGETTHTTSPTVENGTLKVLPSIDQWAFSPKEGAQLESMLSEACNELQEQQQQPPPSPVSGGNMPSSASSSPIISHDDTGTVQEDQYHSRVDSGDLRTLAMVSATILNSDPTTTGTSIGPSSEDETLGYQLPRGAGITEDSTEITRGRIHSNQMDWEVSETDGQVMYSNSGTGNVQLKKEPHEAGPPGGSRSQATATTKMGPTSAVGQFISEAVDVVLGGSSPQDRGDSCRSDTSPSESMTTRQHNCGEVTHHHQSVPMANLGTSTHLTSVYSQPLTCPSSGHSTSNYGYHGPMTGNWHRHGSARMYPGNPTAPVCAHGHRHDCKNAVNTGCAPTYHYMDEHACSTDPCKQQPNAHTHMVVQQSAVAGHHYGHHRTSCPHARVAQQGAQHIRKSAFTPIAGYQVMHAPNHGNSCSLHAPQHAQVVYLPCHASFASKLGWDPKSLPTPDDFYSQLNSHSRACPASGSSLADLQNTQSHVHHHNHHEEDKDVHVVTMVSDSCQTADTMDPSSTALASEYNGPDFVELEEVKLENNETGESTDTVNGAEISQESQNKSNLEVHSDTSQDSDSSSVRVTRRSASRKGRSTKPPAEDVPIK